MKIEALLKTNKNVFTTQDLAVIWQISNYEKLIEVVRYYLKRNRLKRIIKGVYSLSNDYDNLEVAQKVVPFSYISLNTALAIHGINFQYYNSIDSIALKNYSYEIDGKSFIYHKIKEDVFFNPLGIIKEKNYSIADKERSVCDTLYFFPSAAFDNISSLDIEKLNNYSKIYKNKRLEKNIKELIK